MSKLVGFQGKTFTFDDGKVRVLSLYRSSGRTGTATDRVFVSNKAEWICPCSRG